MRYHVKFKHPVLGPRFFRAIARIHGPEGTQYRIVHDPKPLASFKQAQTIATLSFLKYENLQPSTVRAR